MGGPPRPAPSGSVPPKRLTWRLSPRSSAPSSPTPGRLMTSLSAWPPERRSSSPSWAAPSRATPSRIAPRTKGRFSTWASPSRTAAAVRLGDAQVRSEEHTSELQSLTRLVCRLVLEKKKNQKDYDTEASEAVH